MNVVIYHNPRCTKSRQTLELLRGRGIEPVVVEYLTNTPSVATLKEIVANLGAGPRGIIREKEAAYKENGLDNDSLTEDEILTIMVENPILIERPIVTINNKAAIGRPPENVLDIL